ncbi:succinate dehydrogenase cytochrome b subunit [Candidatus Poriferisodalis sp.]|uniref:succinate dehydrogenase cytochrome b subunit n=1 Tax=Candidatus Poriferisodalis sp. TaxID=3101277 RepID=UPI003B0109AF
MAPTATQAAGSAPVFAAKRPWPFPLNIYQSAIGRKWVMAWTGIGLLGFVIVHMIGNLHLYEGPARMHEYAETLRDLGGGLLPRTLLLWIMRVGLLAMFVVHLHSAYTLKERSRRASDRAGFVGGAKKYESKRDYIAANYASRTMRWTGPIVGLYVLFHLADLTWGWWLGDDYVRGDPYHNVVESLSAVPVAILYVVANAALALHIFHGTWSMFQSLGVNHPRYNGLRRNLATALAGVVLVGNLSFPVLVQAGLVDEDHRDCPVNDTTGLECLADQATAH